MKKYIIISVLVMLLCFTSAMAASVDTYEVETETATLVIKGNIEGYKEGNQYRVIVFAKDKAYDENAQYDDAKIADDIIFMSQIAANENGGYVARIGMTNCKSGYYIVRVNGKDAIKLYYATQKDKSGFLRSARSICITGGETAVSELETLLDLEDGESNLVNYFMITDKYVTSVEPSTLASVLCDAIKADPLIASSEEKFVPAVVKAAHVAALDENKIAMSELFDELTLDEEYVEIYNSRLSDKAKASFVADSYKGKGYNAAEAEEAFNAAVAYAYINNFSSWEDAKYFIEGIGKDFDISVSKYNKLSTSKKADVYDYMTDKAPKNTVKGFVKAVNDKIDDLGASGGSGGSTGGSGGGFGGGGSTGGFVPVTPEVEIEYFTDLSDYEWAKESINALAEKGIVTGVGESKFAPGKMVTREEMIAMLIRAYNISTEGSVDNIFEDVPGDSWFASYVAAAYQKGYISGIGESQFGSGKNVTRQDASVMAYNVASANGKTFAEASEVFADGNEISEYAQKAVYALKASGVINGKGNGNFAPKDSCTRAEAAVIIYKLIK